MDANGGGDGPSSTSEVCYPWSILATTKLRSAIPNVIYHRSIHFSLDDCQTKPADKKPEFAKTAYETFAMETQKIGGLYGDPARQSCGPFGDLVAKMTTTNR